MRERLKTGRKREKDLRQEESERKTKDRKKERERLKSGRKRENDTYRKKERERLKTGRK